jgi:hypothetical protein
MLGLLLAWRVHSCEVAQGRAGFGLGLVPTDRLDGYLKNKGTLPMKDQGSLLAKFKDVTVKAASHSEAVNGPGLVHVRNVLRVDVGFELVLDEVRKKNGTATKSDAVFAYDIVLKSGGLVVEAARFEIGSEPFKSDIDLPSNGQKSL